MEFLHWLQDSGLATWVRESDALGSTFPYTFLLALHAIGLAMLVGPNVAVDLRILGYGRSVPLGSMEGFFRQMWVGFWFNALSGLVLLPTSAVTFLTDPIFYVKLGSIALAVVTLQMIYGEVFRGRSGRGDTPPTTKAKILAGTSLVLWVVAIVSGRLMAYNGDVRRSTLNAFLLLLLLLLVGGVGWRAIARGPGWGVSLRRSM
ncbi:MAG: hypothetical protein A3I61_08025 [Acidobacteria bacterium RIFCSPLOWO2_02_FULL_68_18]|nr:MAG: hypothetical protein A3I61_08025 [Acidobacteria bacterium RIFCSPLOWO2_02_FULL_68_18]OFW51189.1 MAG: hypothetical protein A3G77_06125 [Acidobacteria bacterium RIFCSPLOWO2_12_FULL_68_19]